MISFRALVAFLFIVGSPVAMLAGRSHFVLDTIDAAPGQVASGFLAVPAGADGDATIPVTIVNGANPGPVLALLAGVHGSEYPPILALQRVRASLDPKQLSGAVILVQVANMPSFLKRTIYYGPADGKNLNRVFPGKIDGSLSERIAFTLVEKVMRPADYVVDIHGGDNNEMLHSYVTYYADLTDPKLLAASKAMAYAFGFNWIKSVTGRATEFDKAVYSTNAAVLLGKPTLAIESGQLGRPDEEDIARIVRGVHRLLQHLNMLPGSTKPVHNVVLLSGEQTLRSQVSGLFYAQVEPGQSVRSGAKLGYVTDFFGNIRQEVTAPFDGLLTMVVGTPPVSEGEPLASIAKVE